MGGGAFDVGEREVVWWMNVVIGLDGRTEIGEPAVRGRRTQHRPLGHVVAVLLEILFFPVGVYIEIVNGSASLTVPGRLSSGGRSTSKDGRNGSGTGRRGGRLRDASDSTPRSGSGRG
jgi:hypothetical protein